MSKINVKINGKAVVIDTNRPKVAACLGALIEACAERQFPIGMFLDHVDKNGRETTEYQLVKVHGRAYLINQETGRARNSRKVVYVQGNPPDGYYVTDLPAEKDKFLDPECDNGELLDY